MTKAEWAVVVEAINERWPERARNAEWAAAWWPTVAGLQFGAVLAGLEVYGREGRGFPPDAGQLARLAGEITDDDGWDTAWGQVMREVRRVGTWDTPVFDDPAVTAAVEAFGWRALCLAETDDLGTTRAQFREIWRAAHQRAARRQALAELPPGPHRQAIEATVGDLSERLAIGGRS